MLENLLILATAVLIPLESSSTCKMKNIQNNKIEKGICEPVVKCNKTPPYLYKVVSKKDWQESLLEDQVILSTFDCCFIPLATEEQVDHVIQKYWQGEEYVVLKISTDELEGRLVYETNPGGNTKYYHLYDGRIPLDAVKAIN